jgi:hypothetical protein
MAQHSGMRALWTSGYHAQSGLRVILNPVAHPSRRRVRINSIPPDVQAIIAASHPETSINDCVVGALSRRYGLPEEPAGRPSRSETVGESILVKLPEPIWVAVKEEAVPYSTMSAVIIKAIREET